MISSTSRKLAKGTSYTLAAIFAVCVLAKANDERLLHEAIDLESLQGIDMAVNWLKADFHGGHANSAVDTRNPEIIKAVLEEYYPHPYNLYVQMMHGNYDEGINLMDKPEDIALIHMIMNRADPETKQKMLNSTLSFALSQQNPQTVKILLDWGAQLPEHGFALAASLYKGWGPHAKKRPDLAAQMVDVILRKHGYKDDGSIAWLQQKLDESETEREIEGYGRTLNILSERVAAFNTKSIEPIGLQ